MPDSPPVLDPQRYEAAIAQLTQAIAETKPDAVLLPVILEALAARDALQTQLLAASAVTGEALSLIAQLDQHLKDQAATIERCLKAVDWQTSFSPPVTAWWWTLKPTSPNAWWNQDWIWQAVSITCITVAVGLFGDVSTRFLKGGPDTLGAIAVSAQSIGALLTAGGALTVAGQEANKRLLNRLQIPDRYWHTVGAGGSLLLLLSAVGLRTSLPQIASLYSDWGFQKYKQGDWGSAEELYQRALQLNPDNDQASFRLGVLYEELQDSEKARSNYRLAVRAGIPDAVNNFSRLSLLDKKPAPAIPLLLKALEKEAELPPESRYSLLKNLGWARLQQRDYGEAEDRLTDAIKLQQTAKLNKGSADSKEGLPIASPYCLLAQVKTAQGEKSAALQAWETCNAEENPYIQEETEWAVTAREQLKEEDKKAKNVK